jgi:2-methylcitrate dehydratase PrpD
MSTLTDHAIDFTLNAHWENLPAEVKHQAKRCLMDTLGALIAGTRTPVARIMQRTSLAQFMGDQATILVSGERVSAAGAALANGFAGNALDIDDGYRNTKGHPGACALPPVLVGAELSGDVREKNFSLPWWSPMNSVSVQGSFATPPTNLPLLGKLGRHRRGCRNRKASGVERETDLSRHGRRRIPCPYRPDDERHRYTFHGQGQHRLGMHGRHAVGLMANEGFTGICPLFDDAPDENVVKSLGSRWEMLNLYFKPYAACRWGQPAVAGALKIVKQQLTAD